MKEASPSNFPSLPPPTVCPACHARLPALTDLDRPLSFCLYCGTPLGVTAEKTISMDALTSPGEASQWGSESNVSFIEGHVPAKEEVQFSIGPYQILSSIGKGGMGEVFLAYDTTCGRRIALKRIRADLTERQQLHNRFLKEARITSQLTHPTIIPIYAIHASDDLLYYTMPYVEGETLKQILRKTRQQEKRGEPLHHIGASIPALIRIFITVCQAASYAHVKGVLHRDLKPENVMVGRFGEVLILDWGLAKLLESPIDPEEALWTSAASTEGQAMRHLTHLGKVVGTIAYMAPERAMGHPATIQTDVYALGVTLYQILTLHLPFRRETLKEMRQNLHKETLLEPAEIAPYREVPPVLSAIVRKCLAPKPEQRYSSVAALIHDLEIYLEGRSEWFPLGKLDIKNKEDWEFQEHVLIAEHVEITRNTDSSDWFSLMISRSSFPQNMCIDVSVTLGETSSGLGFLMNIPEEPERKHLIDGYCLWLGSQINPETKLLRSNVEVMRAADTYLKPGLPCRIRIEKLDNNIHVYLDDQLQLTFISHLPLAGTHVGLLCRDADFTIQDFAISGGSQNLMVNCLAVPDAFLAHKNYQTALTEYRRIAYSFPRRAEGREALFRAGITLLEQARQNGNTLDYFELALDEFAKLHATPGAPLEYLGKALVYQTQGDYEEEIKCFELALRRYPHHPLLYVIQEHIAHRMHETSRRHRKATYNFALLVVRHLPEIAKAANAQKLFDSLQNHWEPLPFLEPCPAGNPCHQTKNRYLAIALTFWLAKPYVLAEILDEIANDPIPDAIAIGNALFCLIELGSWKLAERKMIDLKATLSKEKLEGLEDVFDLTQILIGTRERGVADGISHFLAKGRTNLRFQDMRVAIYLMEEALSLGHPELARDLARALNDLQISPKDRLLLQSYHIWAELQAAQWAEAAKLLHTYPVALLSDEKTPLYFLYGCWLNASEGREIAEIHFSGALDVTYPRIWSLTSQFVSGKISDSERWLPKAFMWEKRQLYRQLGLYYHCGGLRTTSEQYQNLAKQEFIFVSD